jgi:hypothetical protein
MPGPRLAVHSAQQEAGIPDLTDILEELVVESRFSCAETSAAVKCTILAHCWGVSFRDTWGVIAEKDAGVDMAMR